MGDGKDPKSTTRRPAKKAAGKKAAGKRPAKKATTGKASGRKAAAGRPAKKAGGGKAAGGNPPREPVETKAPVAPGVTAGIPKDAGRSQPGPPVPKAPEVVPEPAPGRPAPGEPPERALPDPITIEIDRQIERLEDALERVRDEVAYWARKGVYTRVRFRFRGRQVLPDIPVAAFLAAEAATFWWSGLLRALAVNFGGGALLDVELISDAEPHLARAQEHLLAGDTEDALTEFRRALDIDRDLPSGHHGVGICLKLQGDRAGALAAFRRARRLDPRGETGRQAGAQIEKLEGR